MSHGSVPGAFADGLEVGMLVESESGWRGRIDRIDWTAYKWPYTVVNSQGAEDLFAGRELTVISETPVAPGEIKDSLSFIDKEIRETEKKLEGLKKTRSVLERLNRE